MSDVAPATAPGRGTRARIVEAAVAMTTEQGWARVTMARVADASGVSRQTVYNEMGTKQGLAAAMVGAELERFLAVVLDAFDRRPDDLVAAIREATRAVLEHAQGNPLLHAVVSATHGADTELLPLLTTNAGSLLDTAQAVVRERLGGYDVALAEAQLDAAIDMVVRVVLSHVMQPSDSPGATADAVAWVAERVLRGPAAPSPGPEPTIR